MFHQLSIATVAAIALVQAFCCLNFGVNQCCGNIQQGFGFSISYSNSPAQSLMAKRGPALIAGLIGTGNKCWVGAGTKVNSMAWTHAASKRSAPASECAAPDVSSSRIMGSKRPSGFPPPTERSRR
ncbi:hypothetical protein C8J57DRAFT_1240770 [Mycena rebaudengoi]|nr:hypothetical protein C8J57DRAFT_1240770 [Mycena rebaudengoi]